MSELGIEVFTHCAVYLFVALLVGVALGVAIASAKLASKSDVGDYDMLKHLRDREGKAVRN